MAGIQSPPILSQIQAARSFSEQAASLRSLRDEIVGHVQRKEWWVQNGILESLVQILQNTNPPPAGLSGKERSIPDHPAVLSEDGTVRLLALQLLASFAHGGTAFLGALHAVGAVDVILPALSPATNHPQVVLAALRAFGNIAASARLAPPGTDGTSGLSDALFAARSLEALRLILSQPGVQSAVQEQKRLVTSLVSRLCKTTRHQNALADSGVLDALASMLAAFVVARGEVVPGAEMLGRGDGLAVQIPAPAPPGADLALVLEALSTIVGDSRFRSCLLLCSPAIMAVFPSLDFTPPAPETREAWNALEASGFGNIRPRNPGALDFLLPAVPIPQIRSQSSRFAEYPPLGFSPSRDNLVLGSRPSTFKFTGWGTGREALGEELDVDEAESPFIPWLILLVRSTDGLERVMAASLLASLFKAGFASLEREQALAVLVIPALCQMMQEAAHEKLKPAQSATHADSDTARRWATQERVPEVLARLVGESETLQKAAHECRVIKSVSKLLKDSYEPQPIQSVPRPWSPAPDRGTSLEEGPPSRRVGPPGMVPTYAHVIKMRESTLKFVAGMATLSNDYRQALVRDDVVAYVVESLSPLPGKPRNAKETSAAEKGAESAGAATASPYGQNPNSVIIAACHAVRALARLPSIVRTTLQDHGVAMPINKLLRHPDAEVQIAASGAVINLVTHCSPMVQTFLQAGIVKTLCEHAHSLNPGLRLNALWALKHLVTEVDIDVRKQCLEELEPGWLVQLISDDASEGELLQARARAAARRTTTAVGDDDYDEDMDTETPPHDDDDDSQRAWVWPGLSYMGEAQQNTPVFQRLQQARALRDAEVNPARRARADSLAITEQGLGFIRNLLLLPTPTEQTDMVDHLFTELGQDRLFNILADKLKVRVVGALGRRARGSGSGSGSLRHSSSSGGGGALRDILNPPTSSSSSAFSIKTDNNNNTAASAAANNGSSTNTTTNNNALVLYPQFRIVENLAWILVHVAAGLPRHRQLVVAQSDLLRLLGGHLTSADAGVRKALCQLFMNLSWLDGDADRGGWAQRALELERMGFLAKLEGMETGDADLGVRERAKAAVAQLKMPTS